MCTRAAGTDTDSHAVDLRAGGEGHGRWRRDTLSDSVVVSDRLQFTDTGLQTVHSCRQGGQHASGSKHNADVHLHLSATASQQLFDP